MDIIQSRDGKVVIAGNSQSLVISNSNGVVTVNGVEISQVSNCSLVIKIDGNAGPVTLNGSGNVEVWGSVDGNVTTMSGDILTKR